MPRTGRRRLVENAFALLVVVLSVALLTPWGITHRQLLQPKFALIAVVFGTLSGAAFFVTGVTTAFLRHGGLRAAAFPFCAAISSFLIVATFLWAGRSPTAQSYTLAGAALFMITAAVLQLRARERSESL